MKLPWRRQDTRSAVAAGVAATEEASEAAQSCPSLGRALERILKLEKPEILDLGPLCGSTAVYLADRGARVVVDEFRSPPPAPPKGSGDESPTEPLRIEQPDARFDLVLAWEHVDFTPPDRLPDLGSELLRVMNEGGWVLLFSLNDPSLDAGSSQPMSRYRLLADDRMVREPAGDEPRQRWLHPTRTIERALEPLSVQGIHLQRNQMREILALKKRRKPTK